MDVWVSWLNATFSFSNIIHIGLVAPYTQKISDYTTTDIRFLSLNDLDKVLKNFS